LLECFLLSECSEYIGHHNLYGDEPLSFQTIVTFAQECVW